MDTLKMNSPIIDSHCHLEQFYQKQELDALFQHCDEMLVDKLITVGTDAEDWELYHKLSQKFPERVFYSVGLHPTSVKEDYIEEISQIESYFTKECSPCALGEIGLDYFHLPKDAHQSAKLVDLQKEAFSKQLFIAKNQECPVIIHSRNAFHDCVEMIDDSGVNWSRVVFHCFSEGIEEVNILNNRGGYASFTGIITYKSAQNVRDAALTQGLDRIMIETDSPYLSPVPMRGKTNQPAFTRYIAEFCAQLFEVSDHEFASRSRENTLNFFDL